MPLTRRRWLALAAVPALPLALPRAARAAAFPERPLKLIVPFPAGGAADLMARGLAQRLGELLGQQVIIDNRGGAGGSTAAEAAASSPADGYTLFFATMGTHAINPALYPKLRYDPRRQFAPVCLTHTTPRVLVAGPSMAGVDSVRALIAKARAKPGGITYGSAGNGSSSHLSGALFASMAGVELLHVPYKGSAPLLTDVLAGRVDLTFDSYTVYEEHLRTGRVKALGVTSAQRMDALPKVPTIAEQGLAGYEVSNWLGVMAPAGTPADVIATLNDALRRTMATPALRSQLVALGIQPQSGTPAQFAALIDAELPRWAAIVRRAGATAE